MVALSVACGGDGDNDAGPSIAVTVATVTPVSTSAPSGTPPDATPEDPGETTPESQETPTDGEPPASDPATATPPASGGSNTPFSGFIYPIEGACLPQGDQLMPNAPRAYRDGVHEGVDFYAVDNCTGITLGTPVRAAKAGRIIRIDHGYVDLTPETLAALFTNPTAPESLDAFRGRQVWVDHGDGVVTRYCHLSAVVQELQVNDMVAQGQVIAYVGESGTPESVRAPGNEYHLHWEVRVGTSYLGAGQDPATVRAQYLALFNP